MTITSQEALRITQNNYESLREFPYRLAFTIDGGDLLTAAELKEAWIALIEIHAIAHGTHDSDDCCDLLILANYARDHYLGLRFG